MLTTAMIKGASAEVERFILSTVPEGDEPHEFSKQFERKMKKLIRRANHPIRYQVLRAAAAIVLVIATLFGAVMAVSPEARAAVIGWIQETLGMYTHYSVNPNNYAGSGEGKNDYKYELTEIPAGYREWKVTEKLYGKTYLYANDAGQILRFSYSNSNSDGVFEETKYYEKYSDVVGKHPADVYIAPNDNETSIIVWWDDETGVLFRIAAYADQTELIKLAETVKRVE